MFSVATEQGVYNLDALLINGHPAARLPADALNRQLRALKVPGVDACTGAQDGLLAYARYLRAKAEAEDVELRRLREEPEAEA